MNIFEKCFLYIVKYKYAVLNRLEHALSSYPNAIKSSNLSPEKIWPNLEKIPQGQELPVHLNNFHIIGKDILSTSIQGEKAIRSIKNNPKNKKKIISQEELLQLKNYAAELGIGDLGFATVLEKHIFREQSVLYHTCIVLLMEMDKDIVATAPSKEVFKLNMASYDKLGVATNKLTAKLRKMGFDAHAAHPATGLVLFTTLAVSAGLGSLGRHGMLLSNKFGPRQRISAIFVDIDNLPVHQNESKNQYEDFCKKCGKCIKGCPVGAIYETPIEKMGSTSCINFEKCLTSFIENNGCSICMKVCPLSTNPSLINKI